MLRTQFILAVLLIARSIQAGHSIPILDSIAQFGNSIKNNAAIESLSLQIVPMTTRIKMAAYMENAYKNMDFEKTLKDNLEKVNTFINEQVVPAAKSTMNSLADMYNKATTNGTNGSGSGGLSDSAHRKRKPSEKPHNEFYEYLVV